MSTGNRVYSAVHRVAANPKRKLAPIGTDSNEGRPRNSMTPQQQVRRRTQSTNADRASLNFIKEPKDQLGPQDSQFFPIEEAIKEFLRFRGYEKTFEVFSHDLPFSGKEESCEALHFLKVFPLSFL